jgi:hypothetical protein
MKDLLRDLAIPFILVALVALLGLYGPAIIDRDVSSTPTAATPAAVTFTPPTVIQGL